MRWIGVFKYVSRLVFFPMPTLPYSPSMSQMNVPVHSPLKFSAVLGVISVNNSNTTLPAADVPI
jgi:hypothetical protein